MIIVCYIDIAPVQLKVRIVGDPLSRKVILHGFHAWQNMANVSQGSSQVCKHHPVSTLWDLAGVVKVWYDGINQYPFLPIQC